MGSYNESQKIFTDDDEKTLKLTFIEFAFHAPYVFGDFKNGNILPAKDCSLYNVRYL